MIFKARPDETAHRTAVLAPEFRFRSFVSSDDLNVAYIVFIEVKMAPHPGIDTDAIKDEARKDLLGLLEGVCKACPLMDCSHTAN